jgi:alkylation response protein AidB-like acyl-CoA dehydrogenase
MVVGRLARHASAEQNRRWLPGLIDGSTIGCLAMTEPEAGSDVMSMRTRAERVDAGWRLNGTKTFITNGPVADLALVYARTGGAEDRRLGLFAIPTDSPGFARGRKFSKMGWRGSPTGELILDDCEVGDEALVGGPEEGRAILLAGLDSERVLMAAESVGVAQGALEVALDYARERRQFGRAIGEFQLIQGKLADMYTETEAARALTWTAAARVEGGEASARELASAAKLMGGDVAMRVTTEAVQVLGGYGYIDEFPVERYMRDAKLSEIGEGTSEVQRMIIAKSLLREGYLPA